MKSLIFSLLVLASLPGAAAPLRVLVVADKADPVSSSADDLAALLKSRGAQAERTDAVPEDARLSATDVLVILGTEPKATLDSKRASLEAFAKRGGGLVTLGGAVGAGEAAWWKPLIGGAWSGSSRKFPTRMMLFTLTDSHPITTDAAPFDLDDETVYDLDLDPSIHVLASAFTSKVSGNRQKGPSQPEKPNIYDLQPQMWAYEAPDGHRSVTLLQARKESLQHASQRTFILRGIAWAAKRPQIDELGAKEDLAVLRYPQGGAQTAAETVKSFEMQPGFKASVIAAEPLITKPIAMQWDGRGRLWIAETPEYPNGRRPLTTDSWKETGVLEPGKYDRPAKDRISILTDPDKNGQFTKKKVFYEGLELLTAFCLYRDGVIALGQPDIVYIHGEGAAQKVERLFTGFAPGDTHFVANHFTVAPDGWIYSNTGSGAEAVSIPFPNVKARVSPGVFRFKPDGSAIEQIASKGGNAFGLDVTSEGEVFFGQATTGNPVQHAVLPEKVLAKGKTGDATSGESVIKARKVARTDMPTRAPFMQIDVVGGFTAACASTVYEGGAWPVGWNMGVFCTEPILDIIHFEKLVPQGVTYTGKQEQTDSEWLRARDFWFFPVDVQFGPDGAMYVLDFYCPVVAHNDTRGPLHSRSGASVRPDRDHYYGRIYRIQHEAAQAIEQKDLSKMDAAGLVKAFTSPNKQIRFTAHRMLLERADAASAVPQLVKMANEEKSPPARILALWALGRLDKLPPQTLEAALKDSDTGVKKAALLVIESLGDKNRVDIKASIQDPDPRVRLTALRAMASSPVSTESAAALLAILPKLEDDWSRSAATAAASSNPGPVLEAALASTDAPSNGLLDLASSLAGSLSEHKDGAGLAKVVIAASKAPAQAAPLVRAILASAGTSIPQAAEVSGLKDALKTMLASTDLTLSAGVLPYAVAWEKEALQQDISARVDQLIAVASDAKAADDVRSSAVRGLIQARAADPKITGAVIALLKTKLSDPLLSEVIAALGSTGDPSLGRPLTAALPDLSAAGQTAAFEVLVSRAGWANDVLDALQSRALKPETLGPAKLSKLRLHSDPATAKRAAKVMEEVGGGTNPAKDDLIAKLQPEIESKPGDAAKGKQLFATACAICHRLNGEGKEVGPVLDGIGVHGIHELLVHIVDPSRVVDNEHRTWNLALKNGQFATGLIARENERSLTLRMAGGVEQEIKITDIKTRQDSGLSLMPEGLEALGADGLRDILAYLGGGSSKYRAVNLGGSFTTDTRQGLYNSREAKEDTVQPRKYGVVTVEGVPFSLPDPTTTPTGGNVIVLKNGEGNGTYAGTMPQRVEIPVGYAAGNLHFLSGVAGWGGGADSRRPAMKVTVEYANGQKQVEELFTGDVFIDYPSGDDVPGSKRAREVIRGRGHVRYFSLPVAQRGVVTKLVLESYLNGISPTTLAVTTDNEAPNPRTKSESTPQPKPGLPKSGETLPAKSESVRALLIGGGSSHDFEKYFHQTDSVILKENSVIPAYTSNAEEAISLMPNADVIVFSANDGSFGTPEFQKALNAFADSGRGVVVLHAGVWYNWNPATGYNKRFVGGGTKSHGKGLFEVYNRQSTHPVMQGVPADFKIEDEHYRMIFDKDASVEVLAETEVEKESNLAYPAVWIVKDSKTRIVGITLGHATEAHENPAFKKLLVNAVNWAAKKK